jgi:tetratricopeptide (TPR) repeat protein
MCPIRDTYLFPAFASTFTKRIDAGNDTALIGDLQAQIRSLPLQASSAVTAKQDELDKLGTELWNQTTRLRRNDESCTESQSKDATANKPRVLPFLRAYAFLLLDSAGGLGQKGKQRKSCIRLIKVALKAARVCIEGDELGIAMKVLERAAEYEEVLSKRSEGENEGDVELADGLRVQYFAVRTTLVSARSGGILLRRVIGLTNLQSWRNNRMDLAEHMFMKCKNLGKGFNPTTTEQLADLLYEIGKAALVKRDYEVAVRWLERAHDVLEEQGLDMLSPEIGELRLSIMQSIGMHSQDTLQEYST